MSSRSWLTFSEETLKKTLWTIPRRTRGRRAARQSAVPRLSVVTFALKKPAR
jgi:hypothetical protein